MKWSIRDGYTLAIAKSEIIHSRKNKGITLIALVITIIVLLILAGVSIATLSGENGILNQANEAKEETKKATALEKVQLEVAGSYGTEGKITIPNLNKNLPNVEGIENFTKIEKLPTTVVVDGYPFDIDEKGNVTLSVPLAEVTHSISPETQVAVGEKITITITATPPEGETITKITKPDGTIVTNVNETTYEVEDNDEYKFIVEASNGGKITYPVEITNGRNVEKFSDIYENTAIYTDEFGKTAKIPAGFAVGIANGINTIENGLVITDQIDSNNLSTGNEFVWIPVINESQYVRNTTYNITDISSKAIDDTDYLPTGITNEKQAVVNAGGFYIARYEAGIEGTETLVSKKGKNVWVSISQTNAKAKAKTLINNSYAKSGLCTGIQWDVTMSFVNEKKDGLGNTYNVTTASSNRHTGSPATSGQNEADRVCNIYDLEGNFYEYIAEKNTYSTNNPYVGRGGFYGGSRPASVRDSAGGSAYSVWTFRTTLYVM